jgi:hypothetical protein
MPGSSLRLYVNPWFAFEKSCLPMSHSRMLLLSFETFDPRICASASIVLPDNPARGRVHTLDPGPWLYAANSRLALSTSFPETWATWSYPCLSKIRGRTRNVLHLHHDVTGGSEWNLKRSKTKRQAEEGRLALWVSLPSVPIVPEGIWT